MGKLYDHLNWLKKGFWENVTIFNNKNSQSTNIDVKFLSLIKDVYENSTINIIHSNERLKISWLWSQTQMLISPLQFNTMLEVLARTVKWEKEIHSRKEDEKLISIHRQHDFIYRTPHPQIPNKAYRANTQIQQGRKSTY